MKISCDVAKDMADVYTSGQASGDTNAALAEHLKTCSTCREYFKNYKSGYGKFEKRTPNFRIEASGIDEQLLTRNLSKLSKRLRTRQMVGTVCAVVTAIFGLSVLLYEVINDYKKQK